jgi:hypothetical protein
MPADGTFLRGTLGEAAHVTSPDAPTDALFTAPLDGMEVVDVGDQLLYVRMNGIWQIVGAVISSGTTTPNVNNGGTATFSSTLCRWQQIGNSVIFRITVIVSANGSGAVGLTVDGTGLPLAAGNVAVSGDRGGVGVNRLVARLVNVGAELTIGTMSLFSAAPTALTGADLANGATYTFHGAYLTV